MSEYNAKNYTEQGGDVTHIGGKLIIEDGASVEGMPGTGGDLPGVTDADDGKILGVSEGEWHKMDLPTELPAVTASDNGKVLGVSEGEWGKVDIPSELPAVTASDNGMLLGVAEGEWGKVDAPSGGSLPVKTIEVSGLWTTGNVSVSFPSGFDREDLEAYAEGSERDFILQVEYDDNQTPRILEFFSFDDYYAVFKGLTLSLGMDIVFTEIVVCIPYRTNGYLMDRVFKHEYDMS